MATFKEFWEISSFRDAFSALIELPDSAIRAFKTGIDEDDLPPVASDPSISANIWSRTRAVVQTLLSVRDDVGFAALIDDVQQRVHSLPYSERAVAIVRQLFEVDPQTEQASLIRRAQYSALPVLVNLTVDVDFRVAASRDSATTSLVPLYIFRLTFDENIAGSDAIVFQVPGDQSDTILRRLEDAKALRESLVRLLPGELVSDQIRREVLGEDKP